MHRPLAPSSSNWLANPAVATSAVLHAAAIGGAVVQPGAWPLALSAVLANHLVLAAAGLWPRSHLLGPNWTRLPAASAARGEVAITIDDGPDPDITPRVLDLLEAAGARASFFVIGAKLAQHPDLGREVLRRGHTLENHSQRHRHDFSLLGPGRLRAEIREGNDAIREVGGEARFFRAPAGLRNPFLQPVLSATGLQLASWTRRGFDTVTGDSDRVLARLVRNLAPADIVLLHDGHAARTPARRPVILDVLPRLLDAIDQAGLRPVTLQAALV